MSQTAILETKGDLRIAMIGFLRGVLERDQAQAVMVPARTGHSALPMQTLVADPALLDQADPLAPVTPVSAARLVSSVARYPAGRGVLVVVKPCEHRALIELAKLKQFAPENIIVLSMECAGRLENLDYVQAAGERDDFSNAFHAEEALRANIAGPCAGCVDFLPTVADLRVCLLGADTRKEVAILAQSDKGAALLAALLAALPEGLAEGQAGTLPGALGANGSLKEGKADDRDQAAAGLLAERTTARGEMLERTRATVDSIDGLERFVANCLNCYNCRNACPVCYCKECVFNSDVFAHAPEDYLRRAGRRGRVKLPADTTMFHLTRLAHMAHACVGCGQCSSVCPSHIPVADLFRSVGDKVQAAYGYKPGASLAQPIPYQVFAEGAAKEQSNA